MFSLPGDRSASRVSVCYTFQIFFQLQAEEALSGDEDSDAAAGLPEEPVAPPAGQTPAPRDPGRRTRAVVRFSPKMQLNLMKADP